MAAGLVFTMARSYAQGTIFPHLEVEPLTDIEVREQRVAAISADGNCIFLTSASSRGLSRYDIAEKKCTRITEDEGAGIQPSVSSDGRHVLHRSVRFDEEQERRTSLILTDGTSREMMEADMRQVGAYNMEDGAAFSVKDGRRKARRLEASAIGKERPIVSNEGLQLTITDGSGTTLLTPNGSGDEVAYLWASLSPDGKHILYYVSEEGTFVCDLQGENVQFIAFDLRAPRWYNDEVIIGMNDRDDGTFIKSSAIVAYTLDGERQQLTDPQQCLMYPFASASADRIVCSTPAGEIFQIKTK